MISHKLVLGDFLRASLYFGRLTAVSYSGEIYRYGVPSLSSHRDPARRGRVVIQEHDDPEELAVEGRTRLRPPSTSEVLAIHSYDGATYLAMSDGLWALPERPEGAYTDQGEYRRLVNRPALDVDMTFGVAAVAHGDGMSVIPVHSRWLDEAGMRPARAENSTAIQSLLWTHHDIVGRTAPFEFALIPARFDLMSQGQLRHYVFQGLAVTSSFDAVGRSSAVSAVSRRSFAIWNSDTNTSTLVSKPKPGWSIEAFDQLVAAQGVPDEGMRCSIDGRVISIHEWGEYLLCEMSDRLVMVDRFGSASVLLAQPATDVRVYPLSRRYRGIVTAVSEAGVHVFVLNA